MRAGCSAGGVHYYPPILMVSGSGRRFLENKATMPKSGSLSKVIAIGMWPRSGKFPQVLVECLASWCAPEDWLYLYYPTHKHISAGLRVVIEVLGV